jgi:nucleoside-diphosphate-sugar epimerase
MRVFLAGATGAIGRRIVPQLTAAGHEVVGTTTQSAKQATLIELGAEPVVLDVLDRDATIAAVLRAKPDAIVHQATALSGGLDLRKFEQAFARTNRLRTEGTDNLLEAARRSGGVDAFVAQSFAGWPSARSGGPVKTEDDPLDGDPPAAVRTTLAAILHLERAVTEAGGIALRYGGFYGPETSLAPGGEHVLAVRARKFPIVGDGAGIWSFVHVDDAAAATVAALEGGRPGIYNVVDDEPAPVAEWLPFLAKLLGAKPPRRFPRWLGRLFAGEHGVVMMTEIRGASNAKAKRELGWSPRYPSYRVGFPAVLGASSAADQGSPGSPAASNGSPSTPVRPSKQSTTV